MMPIKGRDCMIFADKYPTFVLRDVLRFQNEHIDMFNRDRNFSALSFRTRSDAVIESEGRLCICTTAASRLCPRVYRLFADICNEYNKTGADHNDYVDRAKRYIKENCGNAELTVTDIADSLNISAVYLRRLFARYEGMSPKEYLQKHRSKTACTYLSVGGYSVREVALQSGFRDEKYFSIAFKRVVGVSPSKHIYALYE